MAHPGEGVMPSLCRSLQRYWYCLCPKQHVHLCVCRLLLVHTRKVKWQHKLRERVNSCGFLLMSLTERWKNPKLCDLVRQDTESEKQKSEDFIWNKVFNPGIWTRKELRSWGSVCCTVRLWRILRAWLTN